MSIFKYILICLLQLKEEFCLEFGSRLNVYNYAKRTEFQTSALVVGQQPSRVKCYINVIMIYVYICFNLHKCYM
jgi:hypothetical protein